MSKIQLFGFNVHTNAPRDQLQNYINTHQPETMLVLNDPALASWVKDLGVKNVILRMRIAPDEDMPYLFRDGLEWWNSVKHFFNDTRLIVNCGNESSGDWAKIGRFFKSCVEVLSNENRIGAFGGWAVGNVEPVYWQTHLSGFVQAMKDHPEQIYAFHEYMMKHPFLGIQGYTWDGSGAVNLEPNTPMNERQKHILGRYENLLKIHPSAQIIFTEFGYDYVPALANQFGFPTSQRGWRNQVDQNTMISHYSLALNNIYLYNIKNIKGFCLFCLGNSGGWDGFDYNGASEFFNRANELKVEKPMAGTVTIKDIDVEISATDVNYNIRNTAPSGTILGGTKTVIPTFTKVRWMESVTGLDNSGHAWGKYSGLPGIATGIGWIRDDGVFHRDIVEPDPVPNPDDRFLSIPIPELYYGGLTDREKEIAIAMLRWTGLSAEALANYLENGVE